MASQAVGQDRLAVYVLDFQTDIKGDNSTLASDMSTAVETAIGNRRTAFRVLERRDLSQVVKNNNLERELQAASRGQKPDQRLINSLKGADGLIRGEFLSRLDGITLTVSLIRPDSEKLWQGQRRHSLYEWLNGDLQRKEAESLAAEAAAALLPVAAADSRYPDKDGIRGIQLAINNDCKEAMPLLENAAVVDSDNPELFFQMGRCQNQAQEFTAALQSLTRAVSRQARADIFVERARSFLARTFYERALEDLDRALKLDGRNLDAVELRGDIWLKMGRYDDAVKAFYDVQQQVPTVQRCQKLADAYRKNGAAGAASSMERSCAAAGSH